MADDRETDAVLRDQIAWIRLLVQLGVVVAVTMVLAGALAAGLCVSLLIQVLRGPAIGIL